MPITTNDLRYLRRTLQLARRALGHTSPNPMVGAVVVKDGRIIGEGFHAKAGGPHAEVVALRAAGDEAYNATLYCSLEPCNHYGKTPPCCDAIIRAGIQRVVFASLDPNPLVAGRGYATLRSAGLTVTYGVLTEEEQRLNEAWRHWLKTNVPFTTLKLAASLDGKIATRVGESRWITGDAARRDVHRLRAIHDAILTSSNTVLADNPSLTARLPGSRNPRRVILDATLRTSPAACVYNPDKQPPLLVTIISDETQLAPFRARGVEVLILPACNGHVDLKILWSALGAREIISLLIEAGGELAAILLEAHLVQKCRWYLAPMLIGGREAIPVIGGPGIDQLSDAIRLQQISYKRLGDDLRLEGFIMNPDSPD